MTFADSEFHSKHRQTRKEIFLSRMAQLLPWQMMLDVIDPVYPKVGNGRRPCCPQETMMCIHYMQRGIALVTVPREMPSHYDFLCDTYAWSRCYQPPYRACSSSRLH